MNYMSNKVDIYELGKPLVFHEGTAEIPLTGKI